jgi:hypothetical protein
MKRRKSYPLDSSDGKIINRLDQLHDSAHGKFPYDDCRKLIQEEDSYATEGLIPDLDIYFFDIFGYYSCCRKFRGYTENELRQVRIHLEKSFFNIFPEHKSLETKITESNTPDLYKKFMLNEEMRQNLLELISLIEYERK